MTPDPIDRLLRDVEPRTLALAGAALLLISILVGVLYGIKPVWSQYTGLKEKHQLAEAGLSRGNENTADTIAALTREVDSLRDRLYGGAAGVPRRQIESFVVDSLDQISRRHGIDLLGITPDVPTSIWMFEELPYSVKVEGSFFAIHRWFYDVEEELRPMVVKRFQLSPSRDDRTVILDLRVVAYRAAEGVGT